MSSVSFSRKHKSKAWSVSDRAGARQAGFVATQLDNENDSDSDKINMRQLIEKLSRKLGWANGLAWWGATHSDNKSDNKSDDNTELKRINITKIRNEANEIGNLIDKPNYNVDELRNKFNSFYNAYPILFNNLVNKKMSLEELNILLNNLDNVQDHFFKSI